MKLIKILLESSENDLITFGYELDYIQAVVDHLESNYKEGQDYELHIGRGDTHPNAVTIKNPELHRDADLNDMFNAAQSDEDEYDEYDSEDLNENEFSQLAAAIEDELEGEIKDQPVKEAVGILGIISYVLLSNAVASIMSKLVKNIAAKQGWERTENIAKKVYDWAHKNEQAFMAPIERVLSIFMIGPTKKYIPAVTKGLYALFIFMLAGHYGGEAITTLKNSQWGASIANTVKTLVKGTEVHTLFKQVLSDLG